MDIHWIGVAKRCEMKKYEKYAMICHLKGLSVPWRTLPLNNSTVNHQTMTPRTIFLIWMIEAAHRSNSYLTRKQIRNMKMNSLLLPNEDSFRGTMAWPSTSIGESDGESSDSLPLGYWSLQNLFFIFIFNPLQTFRNLTIVDCTFFIAYV